MIMRESPCSVWPLQLRLQSTLPSRFFRTTTQKCLKRNTLLTSLGLWPPSIISSNRLFPTGLRPNSSSAAPLTAPLCSNTSPWKTSQFVTAGLVRLDLSNHQSKDPSNWKCSQLTISLLLPVANHRLSFQSNQKQPFSGNT
eukprot:Lithocolla_globosa_v1_NODE_6162_length_1127_cov_4.729478.p2 type:complete len:141 gc:universal NODE_6162_length_1127_cov_4.729478:489-911(+)